MNKRIKCLDDEHPEDHAIPCWLCGSPYVPCDCSKCLECGEDLDDCKCDDDDEE